MSLRGYALELTGAGERALADAVHEYAERVRGVERGEFPAALSVAPAAIAPQMVGAALVGSRLEGWVELLRNLLIFMPVLWTWLKLQDAVAAYPGGSRATNFFDYWVEQGGSTPVVGGTLADAALQVAVVLVLLVVVNAFLGVLRSRTERRRDREARRFAAVLARAEAAGAARRVDDPQSALAGFAVAATGLTTELRSVGEALQRSAAPFAESVELARRALLETTEAVAAQQRRLDDVIEHLRGIAGMGDQLAELRAEFAQAREAADRSALALGGIRDSLDPSARDFAAAAGTLAQLATHLERMAEAMAGTGRHPRRRPRLQHGAAAGCGDLDEHAGGPGARRARRRAGRPAVKDEGIGIAGWLLADLVLVLAIVFLAFTPAALDDSDVAAATVDAPLILDIGCVEAEQDGRWMLVRCEPVLDGGDVAKYGWEADGGQENSSPVGAYFGARFADVGAVRLTVANAAGAHSAQFLVRPPPAPTAAPTATPTEPANATTAPTEAPDCSDGAGPTSTSPRSCSQAPRLGDGHLGGHRTEYEPRAGRRPQEVGRGTRSR